MRRQDRDSIPLKGGTLCAWTDTVLTNPSVIDVLMPTRSVSRRLIHYRRALGIAYYNLVITSVPRLRRFLLKYVLVKLPAKSDEPGLAELKVMMDIFRADQPIYKSLLTKLVRVEPFVFEDSKYMTAVFDPDGWPPLKLIQGEEGLQLAIADLTGALVAKSVVRTAHYSLLLQAAAGIVLEKCAFAGCTNVFSPYAAGHVQRYCTDSCKAKAYRRHKADNFTHK